MTLHRLCRTADLPEGQVRVFDVGPWSLAAARAGKAVFVLENRCSHDDGAIGEGRVSGTDGSEVECPRHGARFSLATGRATRMPAASPIETFPARIEGEDVVVELPE
jgi:nitrite reductase/ring-hydroxylating ferredoxin subunit